MRQTSSSGDVGVVLTVDANVLLSCVRGDRALEVLTLPRLVFLTTERTTWEVKRYLPRVASHLATRGTRVTEAGLESVFHDLPVVAVPDSFYQRCVPTATELIAHRDPDDVDILALTLRLQVPLWTNDRDLTDVAEIRTLTTAEMIALFLAGGDDRG